MFNLNQQVLLSIANYKHLLLAISGGLDSIVLLDILNVLRNENIKSYSKSTLKLRAIHIHHGLSKHADKWAIFCAKQCAMRDIPYNIIHIFPKILKNTEENYRIKRYQILFNNLMPGEALLTAHHLDDQVETLFLALKRGSGPTGLSAMSLNRTLGHNHLLRPLLKFSRKHIQSYADKHQLNWIIDESNYDIKYDRNFLRLNILPLLKQRWPWFNCAVARAAKLCSEQELLIDELLSEDLQTLIQLDGSLKITALLLMSTYKRKALLRRWFVSHGIKMPSCMKLNIIWKEIIISKLSAMPKIKLDDQFLCRFHNRLYLLSEQILLPMQENIILIWKSIETTLVLPQKLGILMRYIEPCENLIKFNKLISISNFTNKINSMVINCIIRAPLPHEKVSIRFIKINNKLNIIGRNHSRKIKKIWQELDIPPWLRKKIPLLFYNNVLISGLGVFITNDGEVKNKNIFWRISWFKVPCILSLNNFNTMYIK